MYFQLNETPDDFHVRVMPLSYLLSYIFILHYLNYIMNFVIILCPLSQIHDIAIGVSWCSDLPYLLLQFLCVFECDFFLLFTSHVCCNNIKVFSLVCFSQFAMFHCTIMKTSSIFTSVFFSPIDVFTLRKLDEFYTYRSLLIFLNK